MLRFYEFLSFFSTFTRKVAQTWFVLHEILQTTLFGIYNCIKVAILWVFWIFFGTFAHKVAQTWFVSHETLYMIVLKWREFKIIVICYKLRAKLWFNGFSSFFGTFAHKVAQTLFFLHEIWHTTLFGIYYYVAVVRIEKRSHMLEITC